MLHFAIANQESRSNKMRYRRVYWRRLTEASIAGLVAIFGILSSPSNAVMEAPRSRFTVASPQIAQDLKSIESVAMFAKHSTSILVAMVEGLPTENSPGRSGIDNFVLVRIEGVWCKSKCPTAFFRNKIEPSSFLGVVRTTAYFSRGDVVIPICDQCGDVTSIVFFDGKESKSEILIYESGVMF